MANQFLLSQLIYKASIAAYKYKAPFVQSIYDASKYFDGLLPTSVKRPGATVSVAKPVRTKSTGGFGSMNVQFAPGDWVEEKVDISIDGYRKNHLSVGTIEGTQELSASQKEIMRTLVEDAAIQTEADFLAKAVPLTPNAVLATSGGGTAANLQDVSRISPLIRKYGSQEEIKFLAGSDIHAEIAASGSVLFNPAAAISGQYESNLVRGMAQGMKWYDHEMIPGHTNGTATRGAFAGGVTPIGLVAAIPTDKTNTIALDGITTNGTITAGTVIQIAGVRKVNLRTFETIPELKTFAVKSTVTSADGEVVLELVDVIDAGTITATTQTCSALPAVGAVVSIVGEAGAEYRQALAYTKDAFMKASQRIIEPYGDKNDSTMAKTDAGLWSFSFAGFDPVEAENILRYDTIYGLSQGRGEHAVRLMIKV